MPLMLGLTGNLPDTDLLGGRGVSRLVVSLQHLSVHCSVTVFGKAIPEIWSFSTQHLTLSVFAEKKFDLRADLTCLFHWRSTWRCAKRIRNEDFRWWKLHRLGSDLQLLQTGHLAHTQWQSFDSIRLNGQEHERVHEANIIWDRGNVVVTEVQDLEFPEMKDLGTVRRMQALTRLQASAYRFWEGIEFVVAKVQIQQIRTED
jgi:hypothetical protein